MHFPFSFNLGPLAYRLYHAERKESFPASSAITPNNLAIPVDLLSFTLLPLPNHNDVVLHS